MSVILKYGIVWTIEEDKVRLDLDGFVVGRLGKILSLEYLVECHSTGPQSTAVSLDLPCPVFSPSCE